MRLVACDFANTDAIDMKAVRTKFINCRLTGLRAVESECQDFLIAGGDAGFTQLEPSSGLHALFYLALQKPESYLILNLGF
jgi:hypothetical protein